MTTTKLKSALSSIEKKASASIRKLARIKSIKTRKDFDNAGLLLKEIKAARKLADEKMRDNLEGIKLKEKQIKSVFKPFFEKVDGLETDYKLKMSIYLEETKKSQLKLNDDFSKGKIKGISEYNSKLENLTINKVKGGASVRGVKKLVIEDVNKIPREFLVPDEAKIRAELLGGGEVPGCKIETVDSISI